MALMLSKTFLSAGADDKTAREAAEELAGYENRLAKIEGTQQLHSWMLGVVTAMLSTVLFKLFSS